MRRRRFFGALLAGASAFVVAPMFTDAERVGNPTDMALADAYGDGWNAGHGQATRISVPSAVVAGALYDFMGCLTTRDDPITLSRNHTVYDLMDAFTAWANERGLNVDAADVERWSERLNGDLDTAVAEARAEGYERGRAIASARAESRALGDAGAVDPADAPGTPEYAARHGLPVIRIRWSEGERWL